MRTVVLGPMPSELTELVERRRRLGLDLLDEVWSGEYHMAPAGTRGHAKLEWQLARIIGPLSERLGLSSSGQFNLGVADDFRVPDGGILRTDSSDTWISTAALVLEILSPHDESLEKLPFYLAHGVEEVVLVDPPSHTVRWLAAADGAYVEVDHSAVLDVDVAEVAAALDWPDPPQD